MYKMYSISPELCMESDREKEIKTKLIPSPILELHHRDVFNRRAIKYEDVSAFLCYRNVGYNERQAPSSDSSDT